jgi:hypothetical protein
MFSSIAFYLDHQFMVEADNHAYWLSILGLMSADEAPQSVDDPSQPAYTTFSLASSTNHEPG